MNSYLITIFMHIHVEVYCDTKKKVLLFAGFGSPAPATVMFGSPAPSTGMFGAAAQPAVAGAAPGTTGGSLFGAAANTGFGTQAKPAFGFGGTSSSGGLFGQTQAQPTQNSSLFTQPGQTAQQTGGTMFGANSFGGGGAFGAAAGSSGTTVKFNPPQGTDSMVITSI